MEPLHPVYIYYLNLLDIAFQPIVDTHTGVLFGVEALLRGTDTIGFESIHAFFDRLYEENILYTFDMKLREKVIEKFRTIEGYETCKLFYNLDNRLLKMSDFSKGNTSRLLRRYGMDHKSIVFELSEHNEVGDMDQFERLMNHYRDEGFCIALDDFGTGHSGYKLLYHSTPNIIKIDRFFIASIDKDPKKKVMVQHIVQLATLMGCRVIAEGIETEKELLLCKEIGCHLIQGYWIQRPTIECRTIVQHYPHVSDELSNNKRVRSDRNIILKRLEYIRPVVIGENIEALLEVLKEDKELTLVPVVDSQHRPIGIVHEHRLKSVIYSPFGRSLLQNRSSNFSLIENYIDPLPIVDVTMPMELIVELFSNTPDAPGVLIVESSRYVGYLSAREMLEVIHERNLIRARDENPLTRLPGNFMINEYIARAFENTKESAMCYFDFDHFKPYNDYYGFRNGDRVILLFAELMHKKLSPDYFKGHIGGDDFFVGVELDEERTFAQVCDEVSLLIGQFCDNVRDFYDSKDRERGCIVIEDREGVRREFAMLSVSAVVVRLDHGSEVNTSEKLQKIFALEKKKAKKSPTHIGIVDLKG